MLINVKEVMSVDEASVLLVSNILAFAFQPDCSNMYIILCDIIAAA